MCRAKNDQTCPGGRRCEVDTATRNAARRTRYAAAKSGPVQLQQRHSAPPPDALIPTAAPLTVAPAPSPPIAHPTRPHVHIADGWVIAMSEDPRVARRQATARERIGAEHRDDTGRILWGTITDPKLRSLRSATEKPTPRSLRIPPGLVDVEGNINRARLATLPKAQQQRLRELVRDNWG